jgi:glucosamine 6-phosphate synthetase-like amidotransferase/phosphosugar isomerase protein
MCGIGAFQIINNEADAAQVARVLLRQLESRGRDAAGVAWHKDGETFVCKDNTNGKQLARMLEKQIGDTGIVHTRWATQGSPENNDNNHPIDVGGVIGVHNGHISNDKQLLQLCVDYKRCAQVDSEAVFALLAHAPSDWSLADRVRDVRGNAALLWIDAYDETETLHAMRLQSSPLWLGQTVMGSVVFASTKAILLETGVRCSMQFEYVHEMAEGEYVRVQHGRIQEMATMPLPPKPVYSYSSKYAYSSSSLFDTDYSKASKYY